MGITCEGIWRNFGNGNKGYKPTNLIKIYLRTKFNLVIKLWLQLMQIASMSCIPYKLKQFGGSTCMNRKSNYTTYYINFRPASKKEWRAR